MDNTKHLKLSKTAATRFTYIRSIVYALILAFMLALIVGWFWPSYAIPVFITLWVGFGVYFLMRAKKAIHSGYLYGMHGGANESGNEIL